MANSETRPQEGSGEECGREESRGGAIPSPQKNSLPRRVQISFQDFAQKKFEHQSKNTAKIRTMKINLNAEDAIQQSLEDAGISDPKDWRDAFDLRTPEEIEQERIERIKEAKKIIGDFYTNGTVNTQENTIEDTVRSLPREVQFAVFEEWLTVSPWDCIPNLEVFSPLPGEYQEDITRFLTRLYNDPTHLYEISPNDIVKYLPAYFTFNTFKDL